MDTQITKHFTLSELTSTNTGLPNTPNSKELAALKLLAEKVLEPARIKLGKAITVNSGYRSRSVNIAVGGANTSQHLRGEAADLKCADNAKLFHLIRTELTFDQLIWEAGNDTQPAWVHVSYCAGLNRGQVLRMRGGKYQVLKF